MSGRGPQKTCPACDAKVHARKAKCPCGHVFASKKRAASPPRPPLAPLPTSTTGRRRSAGSPASYAEPSLKSKMRQKRGEAVVAAKTKWRLHRMAQRHPPLQVPNRMRLAEDVSCSAA